jgi:hypothetical protein
VPETLLEGRPLGMIEAAVRRARRAPAGMQQAADSLVLE